MQETQQTPNTKIMKKTSREIIPEFFKTSDKQKNLELPEEKRYITYGGIKVSKTADCLIGNDANEKALGQYH